MNEKLKELIENIFDGTEDLSEFQKTLAAKLIQQYADEQALGFIQWFVTQSEIELVDNDYYWKDDPDGDCPLSNKELLTRYHESQKP
jgi:hypothetical protein